MSPQVALCRWSRARPGLLTGALSLSLFAALAARVTAGVYGRRLPKRPAGHSEGRALYSLSRSQLASFLLRVCSLNKRLEFCLRQGGRQASRQECL